MNAEIGESLLTPGTRQKTDFNGIRICRRNMPPETFTDIAEKACAGRNWRAAPPKLISDRRNGG